MATSKKRKRSQQPLSLDDGRCTASKIAGFEAGQLLDRGKVTLLPYPGLGWPPSRPPLEFHYVGTESLYDLLLLYGAHNRVVIAGPRGYGKSSDLRALAVYLYRCPSQKELIVSIWNMEAALNNVAQVVRDAILFAYLVAFQAEKLEKAAAAANNEDNKASTSSSAVDRIQEAAAKLEKEIQKICSMDDAIKFIKRRKREHQEAFIFFIDGWESQPRSLQVASVHTRLEVLFSEGEQVWLSASGKSNAVKPSLGAFIYHKSKPFDDLQFSVYKASSVLGKLSKRQKDIDFYTGRVPLFLDVLCNCCTEFARQFKDGAKRAMYHELAINYKRSRQDLRNLLAVRCVQGSDQETIDLLEEDDDNWNAVLELFREHQELKRVEDNAEKVTLEKSYHSIEEMGKKDATYFDIREQRYCSGYIQRIYVEAFRTKVVSGSMDLMLSLLGGSRRT